MTWFSRSGSQSSPKTLCGIGDDVSFQTRLAQAIAWCQPRADAAAASTSLRSERFRPRILEIDRATVVRDVAHSRSYDPVARAAVPVSATEDLLGGKLLVYFPDMELADGAAEAETMGFFDVNDAPPWDTWVALFSDLEPIGEADRAVYLVSWVPATLTSLVQRGLDVSMTECIAWLERTNTGLATYVQRHGFGPAA